MSAPEPKKTKDGVEIIPIELLGLANDDDTGVYDRVEIEDMEFDEDQVRQPTQNGAVCQVNSLLSI